MTIHSIDQEKPQRHPSVVGLAMMVLQEEEEY
jgi:hypothetical protein